MARRRTSIPKATRELVHQKYQGHCAYCGFDLPYKDMQVDHLKAHARGGSNGLDNLMPSCRSCNYYKATGGVDYLRKRVASAASAMMRTASGKIAERYGLIEHHQKPVVFYFEENK